MRLLPTSLTLVGFTVAAALSACGSDTDSTPGGTAGAAGSGTVGAAGAATGTAGGPQAGGPSGTSGGAATAGSGTVGAAGSTPVAGSGNVGTGGTPGVGGSGPIGTAGNSAAGGGAVVDANGKANAKPGDMTAVKQDYLRMGEIRLINNNWGAAALNCNAPMNVFINADKSFGWNFDRGDCAPAPTNDSSHPDFPQIEFGIHPFGLNSPDATSPNFSSTTLLPKQVKDITSASVTLENLNINLSKEGSWDLTFELWLSQQNPATTQGNAGVYAELMTFWGWQNNRWPLTGGNGAGPKCNGDCTTVAAGTKSYQLVVQDDAWAGGKWRYFQFRGTDGSQKTFNGKVDVKPLLDYLMARNGYSKEMWLARLEVGSEIDDETKGTVTMKNVIFEVNGQTRSPVFSQ